MSSKNIPNIPKEKLQFIERDEKIHDVKFETKPIGYLQDAFIRFAKNKGSLVAAFILIILFLFSVLTPLFAKYDMSQNDTFYKNMLPKNEFFAKFGFWDGMQIKEFKQVQFDLYSGVPGAINKVIEVKEVSDRFRTNTVYRVKYDGYAFGVLGYQYVYAIPEELQKMQAYEKENGIVLLEPMIDTSKIVVPNKSNDPNMWFLSDSKGIAQRDANGNHVNIFLEDPNSEYGDGYAHYIQENENKYKVRVLYKEYYKYKNGHYASFTFGSDNKGYDIITRLAGGARFSFLLGISVSVINILIGVIYGAIEGYYGGWIDLVLERISDILARMPFIVVASLFSMHLARKVGPLIAVFFAFILTGWIGIAYRTRTQFYRFKGSEHVLASRTLGAKDRRLIFKHILPNAIGTLITSFALVIPSVIFSESSLSYLGVIDLDSKHLTSIGTLLSAGQSVMNDYPHVLFFPALFIALMMLSFNIFGNGLRDAFNPSLRGASE